MARDHTSLDDCLIAKLLGPRTLDEFDDVAGGSSSRGELTPFSRKCACLWRQLYGARCGHYNPAATRAAKLKRAARGPLRRATVGVLAAARMAVQCKRARPASAALHPGAGTVQSTRWNDAMQKFHGRSVRNIPGVTQVRAAPGGAFLKPPGVDLTPHRAAREPPKEPCPHRMVAVLTTTASGVERCLRGKGCRVVTGPNRCAEANLVVAVPDLAILHDSRALAADDVDLAVSFLFVVAFGIDVVKETQLAAASYVPGRFFWGICGLRDSPRPPEKLNRSTAIIAAVVTIISIIARSVTVTTT